MRNGTFTNTQDQLIQGCFGESQTPNTEHSSRNRDIHILTITLLSLLIRKTQNIQIFNICLYSILVHVIGYTIVSKCIKLVM